MRRRIIDPIMKQIIREWVRTITTLITVCLLGACGGFLLGHILWYHKCVGG